MFALPKDPVFRILLAVFVAVLVVAVLASAPPLAVAGLLLVGVFGGYFLYNRGKP